MNGTIPGNSGLQRPEDPSAEAARLPSTPPPRQIRSLVSLACRHNLHQRRRTTTLSRLPNVTERGHTPTRRLHTFCPNLLLQTLVHRPAHLAPVRCLPRLPRQRVVVDRLRRRGHDPPGIVWPVRGQVPRLGPIDPLLSRRPTTTSERAGDPQAFPRWRCVSAREKCGGNRSAPGPVISAPGRGPGPWRRPASRRLRPGDDHRAWLCRFWRGP